MACRRRLSRPFVEGRNNRLCFLHCPNILSFDRPSIITRNIKAMRQAATHEEDDEAVARGKDNGENGKTDTHAIFL